jgi:hypothetical protein
MLIKAAILSMREAGMLINKEINATANGASVNPLVECYDHLSALNDELKETQKALNMLEGLVSTKLIPDLFKLRKVKNINIEGVGRVVIGHRWSCSILDGQKLNAHKWLRGGGNGSLIIETVNGQTLGALAHHLSDEKGISMPSDLFNTSIQPYTSITKV